MRQINLVEGKVVAPEGMKVGICSDAGMLWCYQ